MRKINLTPFERDATREQLQEEVLTIRHAMQKLGRRFEKVLLEEWPYHGTKDRYIPLIRYCTICKEDHLVNPYGECNECKTLHDERRCQ